MNNSGLLLTCPILLPIVEARYLEVKGIHSEPPNDYVPKVTIQRALLFPAYAQRNQQPLEIKTYTWDLSNLPFTLSNQHSINGSSAGSYFQFLVENGSCQSKWRKAKSQNKRLVITFTKTKQNRGESFEISRTFQQGGMMVFRAFNIQSSEKSWSTEKLGHRFVSSQLVLMNNI